MQKRLKNTKRIKKDISDKKTVFIGLSGGVDSSVSAWILKNKGYIVKGAFIRGWYPDFIDCDWKKERRDAMRVAAQLDIPFIEIDAEREYKEKVIDQMISQYQKGMTPNPDVWCNKYIKFDVFANKAFEMGADYIATGHYAFSKDGMLFESKDIDKDQTYFMWGIKKEVLNKLITPIGGMNKEEVRKTAKKAGLFTSSKKDSQGLCFLGHIDLKDFLGHYMPLKSGDILNIKGEKIGIHYGTQIYTIGQRHGFEIFNSVSDSKSYFIVSKDTKKNILIADTKPFVQDNTEVKLTDVNILNPNVLKKDLICFCRTRYRSDLKKCQILEVDKEIKLKLLEPVDNLTSGQSIVFYSNIKHPKECLGGGVVYF